MTIQKINLKNNTYNIDTDNYDTMKNALLSEIKYQYELRNIVVPDNIYIYIRTRSLPSSSKRILQFSYQAPYGLTNDYRIIRCYSIDPVKSMNDLIEKLIKKLEFGLEVKAKISDQNQQFIDEVKAEFPYAEIKFSDTNRYASQKCNAKIMFEEGYITLYQDWRIYVSETDSVTKEASIKIINKMLK